MPPETLPSFRNPPGPFQVVSEVLDSKLAKLFQEFIVTTRPLANDPQQVKALALGPVPLGRALGDLGAQLARLKGPDAPSDLDNYLWALAQHRPSEARQIPRPATMAIGSSKAYLSSLDRQALETANRLAYLYAFGHARNTHLLQVLPDLDWFMQVPLDLQSTAPCPACPRTGVLKLFDLSSLHFQFSCACGHHYGGVLLPVDSRFKGRQAPNRDLEGDCACAYCRKAKLRLIDGLSAAFKDQEGAIRESYQQWREALCDPHQPQVPNQTMWRNYELNCNDVASDLRAVASLRPGNGKEFMDAIHMVADKRNGSERKLLERAEALGMLYSVATLEAPPCHSLAELLAHSDLAFQQRRADQTGPFEFGERDAETRTQVLGKLGSGRWTPEQVKGLGRRVILKTGHSSAEPIGILLFEGRTTFLRTQAGNLPSIAPTPKYDYILNPYFLAGPTTPRSEIGPSGNRSLPRLFASNVEANAYSRMPTESIIVPSRLLRHTIDLAALKAHFSSTDMAYLRTSVLDFVTYDRDGFVLAAEEVQRGEHHNSPEWVRKDALKRRALELSGVPFLIP